MRLGNLSSRRWFYPVVYGMLLAVSWLPPITEVPYDPRHTHDVIRSILKVSIQPYRAFGWVFHVATVVIIGLAAFRPGAGGRTLAAYMGLNYLTIAALQTHAVTDRYGFALHTGALIFSTFLGALWLSVAWRDRLRASFDQVPPWRWILLPMALLVFWSPVAVEGDRVVPNFDPLLTLTSLEYGLTYCFVTPVFLVLLIFFHPTADRFAFRVTAFNGLIYGLLNLTHWFNPDLVWMGVMHIPLLVTSIVALFLPLLERQMSQ